MRAMVFNPSPVNNVYLHWMLKRTPNDFLMEKTSESKIILSSSDNFFEGRLEATCSTFICQRGKTWWWVIIMDLVLFHLSERQHVQLCDSVITQVIFEARSYTKDFGSHPLISWPSYQMQKMSLIGQIL